MNDKCDDTFLTYAKICMIVVMILSSLIVIKHVFFENCHKNEDAIKSPITNVTDEEGKNNE